MGCSLVLEHATTSKDFLKGWVILLLAFLLASIRPLTAASAHSTDSTAYLSTVKTSL